MLFVFPSETSRTRTVNVLKTPKTQSSIRKVSLPTSVANMLISWKQEQEETRDLPKVVFHSLRHSGITYKLKLNGGDVKAVQGDSGHAQTSMVTDVYSHIPDDDRPHNAELFEAAFYGGKGSFSASSQPQEIVSPLPSAVPAVSELDPEKMAKLISDPAVAALPATLANKIE